MADQRGPQNSPRLQSEGALVVGGARLALLLLALPYVGARRLVMRDTASTA